MSECVVRMERVPKNCDDGCWGSLSGECPWCDSIDGYKMVGNRPPNCPIIAVLPEGHGRLVDSEEDVSNYITVWDCNCSEFGRQTVMAVEDLHYLPTIVPTDTAERSET